MKKIVLFAFLLLTANTLFAQDAAGQENGVTSSDSLVLQITTLPEAQLTYTKSFRFPFLQGESPLTSGNNINLDLSAELTPISLNAIVNAAWTPIAFFQFSAGGKIGSGWNIELFGMEIKGIGINRADAGGNEESSGSPFDGVHWRAQAGATLQMDMAALFPGDWNHVVIQTYHEINYKGYSRAKAGESWIFQHDAGENQNGFNYYGNFLLGYQMPIFLNTIALLTEADLYLYDTPNGSQWGDNLARWTFSAAMMFTITDHLSASLITQFRTRRNYDEGKEDDLKLYYRNRHINDSNPMRLAFYRVAAALTYTF